VSDAEPTITSLDLSFTAKVALASPTFTATVEVWVAAMLTTSVTTAVTSVTT